MGVRLRTFCAARQRDARARRPPAAAAVPAVCAAPAQPPCAPPGPQTLPDPPLQPHLPSAAPSPLFSARAVEAPSIKTARANKGHLLPSLFMVLNSSRTQMGICSAITTCRGQSLQRYSTSQDGRDTHFFCLIASMVLRHIVRIFHRCYTSAEAIFEQGGSRRVYQQGGVPLLALALCRNGPLARHSHARFCRQCRLRVGRAAAPKRIGPRLPRRLNLPLQHTSQVACSSLVCACTCKHLIDCRSQRPDP